ncbi:hypothetical protein GS597_07315 [Synechococcales cyanobacterium C]|uniref:Uncharacterized protein n=1 Tax=Petrachloros mirabilis ULC683 TaxID=2781853 RepID=A0A8K1ZYK7_9CYAN|nr:hypothetical protein [Petrachloros mirabilis]NCJ06323.1 hypothetical protein [Petrachloros mirabilis ULC683]
MDTVQQHSQEQRLHPRSGWGGWLDRFAGPGATSAELGLQFLPAVAALVAAPVYALTLPIPWTGLQLGLMALLGLDLMGGVLTNATVSAKRWYHRPSQGWQQHLGFVALHVVHIGVIAGLFRGGDWAFLGLVAGYLLLAATMIVFSPRQLQRSVALGLFGVVLLGDRYWLTPTPGLEWFLPFFFLKILVGHLLPESSEDREPTK